jgi:hypothetical protein
LFKVFSLHNWADGSITVVPENSNPSPSLVLPSSTASTPSGGSATQSNKSPSGTPSGNPSGTNPSSGQTGTGSPTTPPVNPTNPGGLGSPTSGVPAGPTSSVNGSNSAGVGSPFGASQFPFPSNGTGNGTATATPRANSTSRRPSAPTSSTVFASGASPSINLLGSHTGFIIVGAACWLVLMNLVDAIS